MLRSIIRIVLFLVRGAAAVVIVAALFYLLQDFQVFPAAFDRLLHRDRYAAAPVPDQVQRFLVDTPDGKHLETWRIDVVGQEPAKGTAIVFRGGSGTVRDVLPYQLWLRDHGFRSYSFDYRGLGLSTGWPSETGIYQDAEAVWRFIRDRENPDLNSLILVGIGIGAGPATWLGSGLSPRSMILFSPMVSVDALLEEWPLLSYATPLLRYHFPVRDLVSSFKGRCLIVAAGRRDVTIPFAQSELVYQSTPARVRRYLIAAEQGTHADLFAQVKDKVAESLNDCWQAGPQA